MEFGRVAQLVEQVTFNHWVTGSNPVALTILYGSKPLKALAFGGLFFCPGAKRVPRKTLKVARVTGLSLEHDEMRYFSSD